MRCVIVSQRRHSVHFSVSVCLFYICVHSIKCPLESEQKERRHTATKFRNVLQSSSSSSSFKSLPVPCTTAPASIWSMGVCWPGGVRKEKKFEVVEKKQERTDSISAHCDKRHMRRLIGPIRVLLWRVVKIVVHWWKRHT